VHGLSVGEYLVQKRYKCKCPSESGGESTFHEALKVVLTFDNVPDFIKQAYPVFLLHRSAVTKEVLMLLVGDVLTAKTFDDIANTIATFRMSKYFNLRLIYNETVEIFKKTPRIDGSHMREFPAFGTFEDKDGYNETLAPQSQYLINVFKAYHESHFDLINACLDNLIPHKVQSLDFTFHVSKRTKDPDGKPIHENSLLFSMNGTGQVSSFVRGVNESHESMRPLLKQLKDRCIALQMPEIDWPEYFYVDNATEGIKNLIREFFPRAQAFQDIKHIINRLIELCKKSSPLYASFCKKIHGAFTGIKKLSQVVLRKFMTTSQECCWLLKRS